VKLAALALSAAVAACHALPAFEAGAAAVEITPPVETWEDRNGNGRRDEAEPFHDLNANGRWDPVWMAGFDTGKAAAGVHDPLWARALVIRVGDRRAAIVALDLVGMLNFRVRAIRERIERELGIPSDHVILAFTHNHSGPDTLGLWGALPGLSGLDSQYLKFLEDRALEAVRAARDRLRPADISTAEAPIEGWIGDSRPPEIKNETATALLLREPAGAPIAILAGVACHPEGIGRKNRQITSDFPHGLRERLEREYPGALAIYVSSDLGSLQSPRPKKRSWEGIQEMGTAIADRAIEALRAAPRDVPRTLSARRIEFDFRLDNPIFRAAWKAGVFGKDPPGIREEGGIVLLRTDVTALRLGEIVLVTVPGELAPELGREARGLIHARHPWLIGLGNDEVGYIFRKEDWTRGEYEETMSLGPETGPTLMEQLRRLLSEF
jgi:hypothetical protein